MKINIHIIAIAVVASLIPLTIIGMNNQGIFSVNPTVIKQNGLNASVAQIGVVNMTIDLKHNTTWEHSKFMR